MALPWLGAKVGLRSGSLLMIALIVGMGQAPTVAADTADDIEWAAGEISRGCIGGPIPYPDVCGLAVANAVIVVSLRAAGDAQQAADDATPAWVDLLVTRCTSGPNACRDQVMHRAEALQATALATARDAQGTAAYTVLGAVATVEDAAAQAVEDAESTAAQGQAAAERNADLAQQAAMAAFAEAYCSDTWKTYERQMADCIDSVVNFFAPPVNAALRYGERLTGWAALYPKAMLKYASCQADDLGDCGAPPGGLPAPPGWPL